MVLLRRRQRSSWEFSRGIFECLHGAYRECSGVDNALLEKKIRTESRTALRILFLVLVFITTYAEWIEEYSGLDNALLERKINTERGTKGAQNPILGS